MFEEEKVAASERKEEMVGVGSEERCPVVNKFFEKQRIRRGRGPLGLGGFHECAGCCGFWMFACASPVDSCWDTGRSCVVSVVVSARGVHFQVPIKKSGPRTLPKGLHFDRKGVFQKVAHSEFWKRQKGQNLPATLYVCAR